LLCGRHVHGKRVLVVTNDKVGPLYLDKVVEALTKGNPNVSVESVILPDGEKYKDMVGILCFELINLCVLRYDWGSIKSMCMLDLIGYSYESL
jgi:3-dehydroquinate synthetase